MKKNILVFLVVLVSFGTGFFAASKYPFSKKDVKAAQKLIGVEFGQEAIDTMHNYLTRNLAGYETMREFELPETVVPPLLFRTNYRPGSLPAHQPVDWGQMEVQMPERIEDIAFYSIAELAGLVRSRQVSSEQLTRFFLERIRKYDGRLEAVITLTEELALARSRQMDEEIASGHYRGPLHGIPYGIKDLFAAEGYPTTWGAAPYSDQRLPYNATVVKRLEEAGAVLVAKLTSGALARGDVWFGGKTRNPWDLSQGASGSSAGSGAAVAAGLVPFAIGTETLGSIVSPASRCGVTGLRPTFGRVSRYGCMSLSWSMDKPGPIGRTATDCALVLETIMGPDSLDLTLEDVRLRNPKDVQTKRLRVAYLEGMFADDSTAAGRNAVVMLETLKEQGYDLSPLVLPGEEEVPYRAFDIILRAEAAAFFDELVRGGGVDQMKEQTAGSRANSLRQARFIPAVEYLQANRHRQLLMDRMDKLLAEVDVLIAPTSSRQLLITNLTGHPALAIPAGFDDRRRPTSVTLVGRLFEEDKLVALASAIQAFTDHHRQHPPQFDE